MGLFFWEMTRNRKRNGCKSDWFLLSPFISLTFLFAFLTLSLLSKICEEWIACPCLIFFKFHIPMFRVCCKFKRKKTKIGAQNPFNLNKSYFHFQNHFDCWSLSFVSIFIYFLFKGSILKPSFDIKSQNRDFSPSPKT